MAGNEGVEGMTFYRKRGRPRKNPDTCTHPDCPKRAVSRGLCSLHYQRARKRGAFGLVDYGVARVTLHLSNAERDMLRQAASEEGIIDSVYARKIVMWYLRKRKESKG